MGAWGHLPFDNDTTNDWAYDLEEVDDLSLVEAAFAELEEVGTEYLDQDLACNALGACEVLARLLGRPGYINAYTEKVDAWVAAHKIKPSPALPDRGWIPRVDRGRDGLGRTAIGASLHESKCLPGVLSARHHPPQFDQEASGGNFAGVT